MERVVSFISKNKSHGVGLEGIDNNIIIFRSTEKHVNGLLFVRLTL